MNLKVSFGIATEKPKCNSGSSNKNQNFYEYLMEVHLLLI